MPAFISLTLNDGASVSKTFGTGRIADGYASWHERTGGVQSLYKTIKMGLFEANITPSVKGADLDKQVNKLVVKINVPVPDSIGLSDGGFIPGASQAYACTASLTMNLPARSTLESRQDLLAFLRQFLAQVEVTNAVEKLEFVA